MKRILKITFFKFVREDKPISAALIKQLYSLLGVSFSVIWLLGWGIDLIFESKDWPCLKMIAVLLGYGVLAVKFYGEVTSIKLRKLKYRVAREKRAA
ncbi:hypothetical protein [Rheinheimera oceanensis]|uniref:hypothetical protein n=1 Tax=Rheinheimera oceanensis TaxID=2817449 RepID=UPI001BFEC3BD|nr:hypothetical protein [Rheinheimera oceanensis]